jgi:hypothetical protein
VIGATATTAAPSAATPAVIWERSETFITGFPSEGCARMPVSVPENYLKRTEPHWLSRPDAGAALVGRAAKPYRQLTDVHCRFATAWQISGLRSAAGAELVRGQGVTVKAESNPKKKAPLLPKKEGRLCHARC